MDFTAITVRYANRGCKERGAAMPIGRSFCVAIACTAYAAFLLPFVSGQEQPSSENASSRNASVPVRLSISDSREISRAAFTMSDAPVEYNLHDSSTQQPDHVDYPNHVSRDPGYPAKPRREKPGDINVKDCPPARYGLENATRAGNPHQVAWWARCSLNENYSAWYVGGGTPWILPWKARERTSQEGTWGADYNGLFQPHRVWLDWNCE